MRLRASAAWVLITIPVLFLAACQTPSTATTAPATAAPTITRPAPPPTLAPSESDAPAAGICARAEGEWAMVEIGQDVPSPRCLQVTPGQKLSLLNRTPVAIHVTLAGYVVSVPAGAEGAIAVPFGEYLASGVHTVGAAPFAGPQIWLAAN